MINHLKTSLTTAIEALTNHPDSIDLQLIGHLPLKEYSVFFKQAIEANHLNEDCSFKKIFGLETNFFYSIESSCKDCVDYYERGIGYIYENNKGTFLKRLLPISNGNNIKSLRPVLDGVGFPFSCENNHNLVLYSSIPLSYLECLAVENCVITSSSPGLPQPINLPNDSFLGRLEGSIESIPFDDNRLINKTINLLSKFKNQLKLQTAKLTAKRAEFDIIDIVPTTDPKAKKGSLCYDESSNSLRFYDGNCWKTIVFAREDNDIDNLR